MPAAFHATVTSPIASILLLGDGERLTGLHLIRPRSAPPIPPGSRRDDRAFAAARGQLEAYFARERRSFDLPLALEGTPWQLAVWRELRRIPYGATVSYGAIAARLGRPGAARAVGSANARNPISIIVPCHRVIGSTGSLTGYGGGIERKRKLLALERG